MFSPVSIDTDGLKSHLSVMMSQERQSGEFLLASAVQDSLLYMLHEHAGSPHLFVLARTAAQAAVEVAVRVMPLNEFTVCETMRGVMHALVSLGGDPGQMAVAATAGALRGLAAHRLPTARFQRAVTTGIQHAVCDMGIDPGVLPQSPRRLGGCSEEGKSART